MVRKVATAKQTSGGGYCFEDKVSSWFLAHFILDKHVFNPDLGKVIRIDYQVRPDDWLVDDILVTLKKTDNTEIKVAVSAKSNVQFTSNGPDLKLLNDIWLQFLNESDKITNDLFDINSDFLCIVNSSINHTLFQNLDQLIQTAKKVDSTTLAERIEKGDGSGLNKEIRKLFTGFACPYELAKNHNIDENDIGNMLSRLILLEFDFEYNPSKDTNNLIELCRDCLNNPDGKKEILLYNKLNSLRIEYASQSGYLNYERLIDHLRYHFQLKGYPNHISDLNILQKNTLSKLESIQDYIGGKIHLQRTEELNELEEIIDQNKSVFILGKSGYGKSVLSKNVATKKLENKNTVVWIDAHCLESASLTQHFNLQNSISDIFDKIQQSDCYLFIDGIDRFFKESDLRKLSEIIKIASRVNSPWKIIISCQTDDYSDVLQRFYRVKLPISSVKYNLKLNIIDHIADIKKSFPKLSLLFKHEHLKKILNNLKYLDILAYNLTDDSFTEEINAIGETAIIDWIWNAEIEQKEGVNGAQCTRFLQNISEIQADKLTTSVPQSEFDVSTLSPLSDLIKNKVLEDNKGKLYFVHDLFGDWARYKLIRSHNDDFKGYISSKDLSSSLWCKGIRLYGLYLLDKNDNIDEWLKLYNSLNSEIPKEKIIKDLLLESIIFSSATLDILELLWDSFNDNKGEMLNYFLTIFLNKATFPNEQFLQLAKDLEGFSSTELLTYDRIPNYRYWPSVILFIKNHINEIVAIASKNVAIISNMWLRKTQLNTLYRTEAANIALKKAEYIFDKKQTSDWSITFPEKEAYESFLAGVNEFPKEVIELALKLCRRKTFEKLENSDTQTNNIEFENIPHLSFPIVQEAIKWEHGPYEMVNETFQDVCLNKNALDLMMESYPEIAKEIILALVIEDPREVTSFDTYNLSLIEHLGWYPPFYTEGPFLNFLRINPTDGIDLIITLVNFATERWTSSYKYKNEDIPTIHLEFNNIQKEIIGNRSIYFWFRDSGNPPSSIVTALMSLEKYLYDKIDQDKSIAEILNTILEQGNSTAFIGLLISIGKYKPELFFNSLKPLLGIYTLYDWEQSLYNGAADIEGHQMIAFYRSGSITKKAGKEWHEMPHRKNSFSQIAISLMLNDESINTFFQRKIINWKKDIKEKQLPFFYLNLVEQLNRDNYILTKKDNDTFYEYIEPQELTNKLSEIREFSSRQLQRSTSSFQYRQGIDKGKKYTYEEILLLWNEIQIATEEEINEIHNDIGSHDLNNIFGKLAILVLNKDIWVEKNPDFLTWTINYTGKILLQFNANLREQHIGNMGLSWMSFVVEFVPILWIENPNNKQLRKLISTCLFKSNYQEVQSLFSNIAKLLKWSEPQFIQVQNLAILKSIALTKHYKEIEKRRFNPIGKKQKNIRKFISKIGLEKLFYKNSAYGLFNINTCIEKHQKDFVAGKISLIPINWKELRLITKLNNRNRFNSNVEIGNRKESGIDTELIHHAFRTIPKIDKNISDNDYAFILSFWDKVMNQIIFELGDITINATLLQDRPNDFINWAFDQLTILILDIRNEAEAEKYWKPILQYGVTATHWVELFTDSFYNMNIDRKEKYDRFFRERNKMIEFAEISKFWNESDYDGQDIWKSLLGLSDIEFISWKYDYKDFWEKGKSQVILWLKNNSENRQIIETLIHLINTKSGIILYKDGLPIILSHIVNKQNGKSTNSDFDEKLAQTISYLWENVEDELRNDEPIFKTYKEILTYLVSKQNSIGIELQNRLILN